MPIYPKGGGGGTTLPNAETVEKFSEEGSSLFWDGKPISCDASNIVTELRTLSESEISAKRITLAHTADASLPIDLHIISSTTSSLSQIRGIDFVLIEASNQISWDGFGMNSIPILGDQLYLKYYARGE